MSGKEIDEKGREIDEKEDYLKEDDISHKEKVEKELEEELENDEIDAFEEGFVKGYEE